MLLRNPCFCARFVVSNQKQNTFGFLSLTIKFSLLSILYSTHSFMKLEYNEKASKFEFKSG